jgi:hypothetical protein
MEHGFYVAVNVVKSIQSFIFLMNLIWLFKARKIWWKLNVSNSNSKNSILFKGFYICKIYEDQKNGTSEEQHVSNLVKKEFSVKFKNI